MFKIHYSKFMNLKDRFNNYLESSFAAGAISSNIALAVSGGSDSIAMLFLASEWAKNSGIKLYIFSVNHGLRDEACQEVEYVENLSKKLGHNFFSFRWNNPPNNKVAIQEKAREMRYDLMTKKCHELSINTLFTAHHFDDLLENYLIRKRKKSSILGLSAADKFFYNNIQVLRPLKSFYKYELVDFLKKNNITWFEDKTNSSDAYERNRVRKYIGNLSDMQKKSLEQEFKDICKQAKNLNNKLIILMAESVKFNNLGFSVVNLQHFKNEKNIDILIYILNYVLTIIGGKKELPRYRNVKNIIEKIIQGKPIDNSLHGCILKKKKGEELFIFREIAAISDDILELENKSKNWDKRFNIRFSLPKKEKIFITKLNLDDYKQIKSEINFDYLKKISNNSHKLVLFSLPVIKNIEKVIAIPHISYYDDEYKKLGFDVSVIFTPGFISRFIHFM